MVSFLRIHKLELRHGAVWALAVVLVLASPLVQDRELLFSGESRTWYRLTYVASFGVLVYPLVAGFGAWLGLRSHRWRMRELLSGGDRS